MDDKEFRKLRREDLIEIIYQYQRREQRLTQENENLRRQLEDRRIRLEKTGSIAEAALALSGIFESAQKAADLYLQSVREHTVPEASGQEKAEKTEKTPTDPVPRQGTLKQDQQKQETRQNPEIQVQTAKAEKLPKPGQKPAEASPEKKKEIPQKEKQAAAPAEKVSDMSKKPETVPPQKAEKKPAEGQTKAPISAAVPKVPKNAQAPGQPLKEKKGEPAAKESSKPPVLPRIPERKAGKIPVNSQNPERKPGKVPANLQNPERKSGNAPVNQPKPGTQPSGDGSDTDAFIASLKEYLGM